MAICLILIFFRPPSQGPNGQENQGQGQNSQGHNGQGQGSQG